MSGITERSEFLKTIDFFAKFSRTELSEVAALCKETTYKQGEAIIRQSEEQRCICIVVSGHVKIVAQTIMSDNKVGQILLAEKGAGDYFGEVSFVTGEAASASVLALENSVILKLYRESFDVLATKNPLLSFKFIAQFVKFLTYRLGNIPQSMQNFILWKYTPAEEALNDASSASIDILSTIPLFRDFTSQEMSKIKLITQVKNYFTGDFVLNAGEPVTFLAIVQRGKFKIITRDFEDQFKDIGEKGPGEMFGLLHFFAGMPLGETIRANSNGAIYMLPEEDFGNILLTDPSIAFKLTRNLVNELSKIMSGIPPVYKNFVLWGFNPFENQETSEVTLHGGTPVFMKFIAVLVVLAGLLGGYLFSTGPYFKKNVEDMVLSRETRNAKTLQQKQDLMIQRAALQAFSALLTGAGCLLIVLTTNWIFFSSVAKLHISNDRCCQNCKFLFWKAPGNFSCHKLETSRKVKDAKTAAELIPGSTMENPTPCPFFEFIKIHMLVSPKSKKPQNGGSPELKQS
jgi:CRP/FNR family transcriptional regulator